MIPRIFRLAAPFIAGAVTVAALPPWSIWPCLWLGFSAFYFLLQRAEGKKAAFWTGWLFGFGYFVFGLAWIARALTVEGSTYSWVIPVAIAGLPALLSMFTGMAALLCRRYINMAALPGLFGFAGLIALSEWARGNVLSGFPWNLYGYGWSGVGAMMQSVALFGSYGLTLLTVLWTALPGCMIAWPAPSRIKAVAAVIIYLPLVALLFWGHARLVNNPTVFDDRIVLRIVQPSIPQSLKWNQQKDIESFERTAAASKIGDFKPPEKATVLMIWPETAVNQQIMQHPRARSILDDIFAHYPDRLYLATGLLRWDETPDGTHYFNSIGMYDKELHLLESYDKSHLVPFGEYIPLSRWLPANPFVANDGFQHGPGPSIMALPLAGHSFFKIAPQICYEVIFPGNVVKKGSGPGLMLNVTNDGWYGDSAGPRQHLEIARFRAIEEGLPMARAANTGISAVIDAYGRVVWRTHIFEVTAGGTSLPRMANHATLYSEYGDCTALIGIGIFCIIGWMGAKRKAFAPAV